MLRDGCFLLRVFPFVASDRLGSYPTAGPWPHFPSHVPHNLVRRESTFFVLTRYTTQAFHSASPRNAPFSHHPIIRRIALDNFTPDLMKLCKQIHPYVCTGPLPLVRGTRPTTDSPSTSTALHPTNRNHFFKASRQGRHLRDFPYARHVGRFPERLHVRAAVPGLYQLGHVTLLVLFHFGDCVVDPVPLGVLCDWFPSLKRQTDMTCQHTGASGRGGGKSEDERGRGMEISGNLRTNTENSGLQCCTGTLKRRQMTSRAYGRCTNTILLQSREGYEVARSRKAWLRRYGYCRHQR